MQGNSPENDANVEKFCFVTKRFDYNSLDSVQRVTFGAGGAFIRGAPVNPVVPAERWVNLAAKPG